MGARGAALRGSGVGGGGGGAQQGAAGGTPRPWQHAHARTTRGWRGQGVAAHEAHGGRAGGGGARGAGSLAGRPASTHHGGGLGGAAEDGGGAARTADGDGRGRGLFYGRGGESIASMRAFGRPLREESRRESVWLPPDEASPIDYCGTVRDWAAFIGTVARRGAGSLMCARGVGRCVDRGW